jgi:hypothetical protein
MKFYVLLSVVVAALALASSARAHQLRYSAPLTGGDEATPNNSPASGYAIVTIDYDVLTMRVQVSFSNLAGTVTSADVYGVTSQPFSGTGIPAMQEVESLDPLVARSNLPDFPPDDLLQMYDRTIALDVEENYNPAFIEANGGNDPQFSFGTAFNALLNGFHYRETYLNINTTAFPDGEIRGFPVYLLGDYNNNGFVDAADYTVWRDTQGQTGEGLDADSDNSNSIDDVDYDAWRDNFGYSRYNLPPAGGNASGVPEPSSVLLVAFALGTLYVSRRRR